MHNHKTLRNLFNNSRFYILISSILLSVLVFCWLRLQIPSDQLLLIRTQQVFGFIGLAYVYAALLMTPLSKLVGKRPWMDFLLFARRAIGVSAAYFAVLHAAIALWGQLGGPSQLAMLPDRFQWSLLLGLLGLIILAIMAGTSFDKAIAMLTFPRWKRIHRFVYFAGVATIVHIWLIGTHAIDIRVQIVVLAALMVLFGLEALRMARTLAKKYTSLARQKVIIVLALWLLMINSVLIIPRLVGNYHAQHEGPGATHGQH